MGALSGGPKSRQEQLVRPTLLSPEDNLKSESKFLQVFIHNQLGVGSFMSPDGYMTLKYTEADSYRALKSAKC